MSFAANTPDERARHMLNLTRRLTVLMEENCVHLRAHRPQDMMEHMRETQDLSALYHLESGRIKANPNLIKGLSLALKEQLKAATLEFNRALEDFSGLTETAKIVSEGIVSAVAQTLQVSAPQASGYTANGSQSRAGLNSFNYGAKA